MAKKFKVIIKTASADINDALDVTQGQGGRGQPLRIKAKTGAKYQLVELETAKAVGPDYVKVKRVGKNLHILFEDSIQADVIIEDYYEVMPEGYNGVIGQAENGNFYEYMPEVPDVQGLIPQLADGGQAISLALGGTEVVGAGAAVGILAFNPLLAVLGLAGAGAAATAGSGTTETTSNNGAPAITSVTDNVGNTPDGNAVKLSAGGLTNDDTPTLNGTAPVDTVVTIRDGNTVLGSVTTDSNGSWTFTPSALSGGAHSFTASTPSGGTTAPFIVTVDTVAPRMTVETNKANLLKGETATLTFKLTEASTDFQASDITAIGGVVSNLQGVPGTGTPSLGYTQYTATFTPNAGVTSAAVLVSSHQFSDAAGNLNQDGADTNNSVSMSIASANSTVNITEVTDNVGNSGNGTVSLTNGGITNDSTPTFKGAGTPGEVVTIKDGDKVVGSTTVNPDGTWNFTAPEQATGPHSYTASTLSGGTTAPFTLNIDTIPPTIAVNIDKSSLNTDETSTVTFTLSEASTDFANGDITVTGGSLSPLVKSTSNPLIYTATFTPAAGATVGTVKVDLNKFSDAAGNFNQDGSDTDNTDSVAITPAAGNVSITLNPVTGDNIINLTESTATNTTVNGKVTGVFAAGDKVTLTINTVDYTATVAADGSYSLAVKTSDLLADRDSRIDASVTTSAGTAKAIQNYGVDTSVPNGGQAMGLTITTDINNDGWLNRTEMGSATTVQANATFDASKAEVGDKVTISLVDGSQAKTITLDAATIAAGKVSVSFAAPAEGAGIDLKAVMQDGAGNTTPEAIDSVKRDTSNFGPDTNPLNADKNIAIEITSDLEANGGNAVLNATELASGKINVKVTLSADAKAGDTLVVEGTGNGPQNITLSAAQVTAKAVLVTFDTVPAKGTKFVASAQLSDIAQNTSAKVEDFAVIDTSLPGAPTVTILEDANNNAFISRAELSGQVDVKVTAPSTAVVGDTLTVTDGTSTPKEFVLTAADLANGITTSFAAPADGATIGVSATLKVAASGNISAPGTDSAKLDLTDFSKPDPLNPTDPTQRISAVDVNIDTDAGGTNGKGDGFITAAELTATANQIKVTILLPQGAAVGDTLTVKASGNNDRLLTLTQADITAQKIVITDYNSVGNSNTFTVTASIKDIAGNTSPTPDASDSAIIRSVIAVAPVVTITEDANNDGFISTSELSGTVGVNISIPTAAQAGDTLKVTVNGTPQNITLTALQIAAGSITQELPAQADGTTLTVSAQLIDQGNQASGIATDSALFKTSAPTGTISIDAITGDDLVSASEAAGTVTITGSVSGTYKVGDIVTITVGGSNYSAAVNDSGQYSVPGVPGSKLVDDFNTGDKAVSARILAHDSVNNSATYTATPRPFTLDSNTDTGKTALTLNPVTGDNIIDTTEGATASTTLTGKVTGTFAAGDVVTITLGLPGSVKTFSGTVNAAGDYSITVDTADLKADTDTQVEARLAATVSGTPGAAKQTAITAQDYVVQDATNVGKITALSIDPVTADNIINAQESTTTIAITGTVTGKFSAGDTVTLMINGAPVNGSVNAQGGFSINVPAADLIADSNTQIEASLTGTGGTYASALQNYAVDTTVPATTVTITAISLDTGTSSTDFVTKDNNGLTVTGTLSTALTAGQKLWYSNDNGMTWTNITTDVSGTSISHVDAALTSTNTVQMRVESASGNYGTLATQLVIIDTSSTTNQPDGTTDPNTAATITISSIDDGNSTLTATTGSKDTGASASDFVTSDNDLSFYGTTTGFNGSAGAQVFVQILNASNAVVAEQYVTPDAQGQWKFDNQANADLVDGSYTIAASIVDKAGNPVKTDTQALVIKTNVDPTDPNKTATVDITSMTTDSGVSGIDFVTNDNTLTYSGTVTGFTANGDKVKVELLAANGTTVIATAYVDVTATTAGAGTWAWAYETLQVDGQYTVRATLVDAADNRVNGAVGGQDTQVVIVDTDGGKNQPDGSTNPNTTATIDIVAITDDSGVSSADFITNDKSLTYSGTVTGFTANGDKVKVELLAADGTTVLETAYVDVTGASSTTAGAGAWTWTRSAEHTDGQYTLRATIVDTSGNRTNATAPTNGTGGGQDTQVVIVDNSGSTNQPDGSTNPNTTATIDIVGMTTDSGSNTTDFITNDTTLTYSGTVSNFTANSDKVKVEVLAADGTTVIATAFVDVTAATGGNGTWTWPYETTQLPGNYSVRTTLVDTAGNRVNSAAGGQDLQTIVIDSTGPAPVVSPEDPLNPPAGKTSLSVDSVTADNTLNTTEAAGSVTITGTVRGDFTAGDVVTLTIKGTPYSAAVNASGVYSIAVPGADLAADSDKTIDASVVAHDKAGNPGTITASKIYTLESAVTTTVTIDAISLDSGASATDFITNDNNGLTVTGILSTALTTGQKLWYSGDNGVTWTDITADVSGTAVSHVDAALTSTNTVKMRVESAGGNFGAAASHLVTIDTSGPTPVVNPEDPLNPPAGKTSLSVDSVTADNTLNTTEVAGSVTITGTVRGDFTAGDVVTLTIKGTPYSGTVNVSGVYSIPVPGADLAADTDKTIDASVVAHDKAGNPGTITATKAYTLETPVTTTVTIDAISLDTGTNSTDFVTKDNDGLTVNGTLNTALTTGQKLWYSNDNGVTWTDITADVSDIAVSHVDTALTNTNTVQMRVESAGGNYGTSATQLVTIDATAPVFTSTSTATAVDENITALTTVYTATATDARTVSYSLKAGLDASSFSIDPTTGVVKLNGSPDYETQASYSFTVLATDAAGNTREKVVSLAINNVNEAPVNTVPGTQTAMEDVNQVIAGLRISDVDAGSSNVTVTLVVTHGTLTIDAASSGVTVGANNTASVTLTGSQAQINTLLLGATGVTYVPTANFNGQSVLTMTTNDGGNTGLGNALSDQDTVTLNVTAVNDQPAAVALSYTGLEDNGGVNLATAPVPTGAMGALVSSLADILASSNDVDNTNLGVAITSGLSTSANGKLWYSTDGGSTWTDLSTLTGANALSETNALVLSSTARLYFQGSANTFGAVATANMRLWDGTDSAASGSFVNVTAASGASGAYAAANSTLSLNLTAINDEPALSATGTSLRTNAASNLTLFSNASADLGNAAESAQKFSSITLTVSGLFDDSAEGLTIDGTSVALVNGSTTTTNGWTASVTLVNGSTSDTATVTLTHASGATVSELNTLVNGMRYSNASSSPTDGDRVITITSLKDNGVTANAGDDTAALSIASTITLDTTASTTLATIDAIHDDIGLIKGVIANNGKTDDTSLNISGTLNNVLVAGETLRIYDGATLLGTAVVTTTGSTSTWTFADGRTLIDAQTVAYKAVVYDGLNEGVVSNTYSATVDLTPPVITITSVAGDVLALSGTDSTGNGTYDAAERGADAATATSLPVISGTTTAEVGQLVVITLNGKTYSSAVQTGGTWSVEVPNADAVALNHGNTLPIIAAVTDQAGLSATDSNNQLVVNIATPDVPTVVNKFSSTLTPTLTGMAQKAVPTDPVTYMALETGDTLTVTVGGATYTGTLTIGAANNGLPTGLSYNTANNQWSLDTATATPSSGPLVLASANTYNVGVQVVAGGVQKLDISSGELRINTANPVIVLDVISGDSLIDASEKNTPLLITGTTNAEVGSTVTITGLDGTPRDTTVIAGTGSQSGTNVFSLTVPAAAVSALADNTYTVSASVTNAYNLNGTDTEPVKVDFVASTTTVTITAINDDVGTITGVVANDGRTDDTQLGVSGTLNAALVAGEVVRVYDGMSLLGTATVTGTGTVITWTFADPRTLINAQKVTYTALVFDGANKGTVSNSYSATVDLTPPTVVNDINTAQEKGGAGNTVAGTDPSGDVLSNDSAGAGDSLIVKDVTGSGSATAVAASGTTNIVGSYGTLTIAANGTYSYAVDQTNATVQALNVSSTGLSEVFTYTAKDVAGLTTSATLTITVNGANDAATFSGDLSKAITESNAAQSASGTLTVTDVDSATTVMAQSNVAGTAGLGKFSITSAGAWSYVMDSAQNQLKPSDVITDSLTVSSADGTNQVISVVITGTNDAPVLTTSNTLTYTEGQAATAINTLVSVTDVDSTTQTSATVAITGGYVPGEDALSFVGDSATMGNITGSYSAGVMSLVSAGGTATLAQWQAALQAVKYNNTSSNPSTASRTVSYTVNDGALDSVVLTSTINLVGVNNAPVNTVPTEQTTAEDTAKVITGLSIADVDAAAGTMTVTLSVTQGTINVAAGTGVTLATNNTASVTLSGTVTDINALLATASAVTYTPTLNYNGSDTLTMLTSDGGNTGGAALTDSDTVAITVTALNDAPVLVTPTNSFTTAEDAATTFVISTQLTGKVTDADSTNLKGIVVVQNTSASGTWAYSTDGTTWVNFPTTYLGTVDWSKVMYLNASDSLRYTPAANANGANLADLNFRPVDATFPNTASGTQVNVTTTIGGTGAVGNEAGHFLVSVTAVNDAPVFPADVSRTTLEDTTFQEQVSSLLSGNVTDVDSSSVAGIAIIWDFGNRLANNGTWYWSDSSQTSWTAISKSAYSNANSIFLKATDYLRFVPAPNTDESDKRGNLVVRVADDTMPVTASGTVLNLTTLPNYWSTAEKSIIVNLTPVNDAPVINTSTAVTITAVSEDSSAPSNGNTTAGMAVSDIFPVITDVDTESTALKGIAITAVNGNGTLHYSSDNGVNWQVASGLSINNALHLDANGRVFFKPNADWNGTIDNAFLYLAWDKTNVATVPVGSTSAISGTGGSTAYSLEVGKVGITVNAVNDAPVVNQSTVIDMTTQNEDAAAPVNGNTSAGTLVSSLIGAISDIDAAPLKGIALTAINGTGTLYYSIDNGATWLAINNVDIGSGKALLLDGNSRVFFKPTLANWNGYEDDAIWYRGWDETNLSATVKVGDKVDVGTTGDNSGFNGGVSAFSAVQGKVGLTVAAVNDAPVNTVPVAQTTTEDTDKVITGLQIADVDAGAASNISVTLSALNGTITMLPGAGTVTITNNSTSSVSLTGTLANINTLLSLANAVTYKGNLNYNGTDTLTMMTTDNGNTGTGGTLTDSDNVSITVSAVNDAPVVATSTAVAMPAVAKSTVAPVNGTASGVLVSTLLGDVTDADTGALKGMAIGDINGAGTLYYSINNGTTWLSRSAGNKTDVVHLDGSSRVMYVSNTAGNIANAFRYWAWDQTNLGTTPVGTISAKPTTVGGSTAYSSVDDVIGINVVAPVTVNTVSTDSIVAMNEAIPLTGSANAGATVNLSINGTSRSVVADASGNWSYNVASKPVVRYVMVRKSLDGTYPDFYAANGIFAVENISVTFGGTNVATGKTVTYGTSTSTTLSTQTITDADTATNYETSTTGEQWVQVDLGAYYRADSIKVDGRSAWGGRLNGSTIYTSGENMSGQTTAQLNAATTTVASYAVTGLTNGGTYSFTAATKNASSPDFFMSGTNTIIASQTVSGVSSTETETVTWRPYTSVGTISMVDETNLPEGSGASTCQNFVTLSGVLTSAFTNGERVKIYQDGGFYGTYATVTGTTWTFTNSNAMTTGQHIFEVLIVNTSNVELARTSNFIVNRAATPLVLDLNGDGVQTTSLNEGTQFDLLNTGKKINLGWVDKHDGLLVMDLNGDGLINNGSELFGDHTVLADGSLAKNGWVALAAQDSNRDGKIDAQDANFNQLRVWVDANSNGITDAGELRALVDAQIASIDLNHDNSSVGQNGNLVQMASSYTTIDGSTHAIADVGFKVQNATSDLFVLTGGDNLDLSGLGNLAQVKTIDMATDTSANTLKLSLADVLRTASTDGVHTLALIGDANDRVVWDQTEWSRTGSLVDAAGHNYVVYSGSNDSSVQLLIDQQMLTIHLTS